MSDIRTNAIKALTRLEAFLAPIRHVTDSQLRQKMSESSAKDLTQAQKHFAQIMTRLKQKGAHPPSSEDIDEMNRQTRRHPIPAQKTMRKNMTQV